MKIAISADCFSSYTSGFPVRGMMLALIKNNPDVRFLLLYTRREQASKLKKFYETINAFPNVQVQYFHDGRKIIALKRMLTMPYINLGTDVDCFLNPGHIEYINGYKGVQICSLADLSTIKGLSTYKNALFYKYWNRLFYRLILPKLSRIVTISDYTQKDLIDFYPQLRSKIVRIYNGISPFWTDDV